MERGNTRSDKRVQLKVVESKDAQGLLMSAAYDILLVLIETHCGVSSITSTSWASLEVEKVWLEVEQERAKNEWESVINMCNIDSLCNIIWHDSWEA